eukprot:Gb_09084 [translate_table: standard]
MGDQQHKCSVCVTGAGGYIGSWLVKKFLDKGYAVHATLRDLGNQAKTRHLLSLPGAKESLNLFKSDLFEDEDRIGGVVATSSKKLLDMGFSYNYGLQEILDQSIKCAIMMGGL